MGALPSGENSPRDSCDECDAFSEVVVAGNCSDRVPNGPKMFRDMAIRNIGIALLLGNSARMENGPVGAANADDGAYHAPSLHEHESEGSIILPSLAGLTDTERRDRLIGLLDDVRKAYESARTTRVQLMVEARHNGLSCHDIGIVLGITENAVRAQIKRAKAGVP